MAWRMAAVAGGFLAGGVIIAPPGTAAVLRFVLLVAVALAMVGGVLTHRQAGTLPWWLLAGSVATFALASAIRLTGLYDVGAVAVVNDVVVLAGYLLLAAGALHLARLLDPRGDREGILDGAIVAVAVATVLAAMLFQPALLQGGGPSRVHLFVGPLVFAAIAGIITRFALLMPRRCPSAWLLVGATAAGLGGNLLRTASVAGGHGFSAGSLPDVLLLAGYVAIAVAALHPSMTMLSRPDPASAPVRTRMRLLLLGAALLVPPALLAFGPAGAGRAATAAAAALVNVLALGRLAQLLATRERANRALRAQTRRDPLTGLPNRLHVDEVLAAALARARRSGDRVGVLFCDLDGFKAVNDQHGHRVGDEVLVEIARRMQDTVRAGDTLARLAGDEFVIVAEGLDEYGGRRLADRLERAVSAPIVVGGEQVTMGVSVGIGFDDGGGEAVELIGAADLAMYEAKRGRGGDDPPAVRSSVRVTLS